MKQGINLSYKKFSKLTCALLLIGFVSISLTSCNRATATNSIAFGPLHNASYAQIHQVYGYKGGDIHRIDTADEVTPAFMLVFWQLRKDQRRALLQTMAFQAYISFIETTLDSINPEKNDGKVYVSDPAFYEQFIEIIEISNIRFDLGIAATLRLSGTRYLLAVEKDSSGGKILNIVERRGNQASNEASTVPDYLKESLSELSWRVITVNEDGEKTARFFAVEPNPLRDTHLIRALYGQ